MNLNMCGPSELMPALKAKVVYLNDKPIGTAATWHEVARLLSDRLGHFMTARDAQNCGSEGPNSFHIAMTR
jgi:hypothetical protein